MFSNLFSKPFIEVTAAVFPESLFRKDTDKKVVSLTFDDLPARDEDTKQSTRAILDAISSHNQKFSTDVSATFFLTTDHFKFKNDPQKLDLAVLKEIVDRGHEIGNHGMFDRRHSELSKQEFETEFVGAHQFLVEHTQQPIRWFRPAQTFNSKEMREVLSTTGQELGYQDKFALASMVPLDTQNLLDNPNFTLKNIKSFTFPGSILLLHGGSKRQAGNTLKVIEKLLPWLYERDYQVVSLSKLIDL